MLSGVTVYPEEIIALKCIAKISMNLGETSIHLGKLCGMRSGRNPV